MSEQPSPMFTLRTVTELRARVDFLEGRRDELQAANNRMLERAREAEDDVARVRSALEEMGASVRNIDAERLAIESMIRAAGKTGSGEWCKACRVIADMVAKRGAEKAVA